MLKLFGKGKWLLTLAVLSMTAASISNPAAGSYANQNVSASNYALYVSPLGSDSNPGTEEKPFRTIEKAQQAVRERKAGMTEDWRVILREGTYRVEQPITFTELDSGENGHYVSYEAYPGETPVIDGGIAVTGWETYEEGMYRARVEGLSDMRELYVNDIRQPRASSGMLQGAAIAGDKTAFKVAVASLPEYGIAYPEDLSYYTLHNWRLYLMPIERLTVDGDWATFYFRQPYINMYLTKFNFEANLTGWFYLENALEFLDEPGEWYFDKRTKYIYYKPQQGVDLHTANAVAPLAEELLDVRGSAGDAKAHHLQFKGLTFRHATWKEVNVRGFANSQTTLIVNERGAYADMLPAAVNINQAHHIRFERNTFEHFGRSGINAENGIADIEVIGNRFYNIAGGAVSMGNTANKAIDQPGEELPRNLTIDNNVLREIGVEFHGSAGITTLYADTVSISHNDIDGVDYSGISVGWGWDPEVTTQKNITVGYNKIQNVSRRSLDGAAIYSLSRHENSAYVGNYIKHINAPFNSAALYHDDSSRGFVDTDNVLDIERGDYAAYTLNKVDDVTIDRLYTTTGNIVSYKNGANVDIRNVTVVADRNWPEEAKQIMENAGLEPAYADLLNGLKASPYLQKRPVLRSVGLKMIPSNMFVPGAPLVNEEANEAPFAEENGLVVMDAKDYTGYVGLGEADQSFIGALGWVNGFASKYYLFTRAKEFDRLQPLAGKPSVSYDVCFSNPGLYHVLLRGQSQDAAATFTLEMDGSDLGKIAFPDAFAYVGRTTAGEPLTVSVETPGVHTIKVTADRGDLEVLFDRIALTQEPTEELRDGSRAFGPVSSKKRGHPDIWIPPFPDMPVFATRNLALGQPVSATSRSEFAPLAVDGNDKQDGSSEWYSDYRPQPNAFQVDLGKPYPLTKIVIKARYPVTAYESSYVAVYGSNSADFAEKTKLAEFGQDNASQALALPVTDKGSYRYIRIEKTQGNLLGFAELEVWGNVDESGNPDMSTPE